MCVYIDWGEGVSSIYVYTLESHWILLICTAYYLDLYTVVGTRYESLKVYREKRNLERERERIEKHKVLLDKQLSRECFYTLHSFDIGKGKRERERERERKRTSHLTSTRPLFCEVQSWTIHFTQLLGCTLHPASYRKRRYILNLSQTLQHSSKG